MSDNLIGDASLVIVVEPQFGGSSLGILYASWKHRALIRIRGSFNRFKPGNH